MIHIVGLGAGGIGQLTLETYRLLKSGKLVYIRTENHPAAQDLQEEGLEFQSFDAVYDQEASFEMVYRTIADKLIAKAKEGEDLIYAVPGNPVFGETSVMLLIRGLKEKNIPYHLYPATSFIDTSMVALEQDIIAGFKVIDAFEVGRMQPDPSCGNLILQVYDRQIMSEVKLRLMEKYPEDFRVFYLYHTGIPEEEKVIPLSLYEIDRETEIDHLTSLYLPPVNDQFLGFEGLLTIMEVLRSPEGCPWDREQTHESVKGALIEETYEVIDAIETKDTDNFIEELGDLLFQIIFHAQLAKEKGLFSIDEVIAGINEKMVRRHPHVFKDIEVESTDEVLDNWDEIKKDEKHTKTLTEEMRNVPRAFTALLEAYKVSQKAAKVGFDWPNAQAANAKVEEEFREVEEALAENDFTHIEEEIGDLLFAVVNVARLSEVQPELALKKASAKFVNRFEEMESKAINDGVNLNEIDSEALEKRWNKAKSKII